MEIKEVGCEKEVYTFLFRSNRPFEGKGEPMASTDIWIAERDEKGWGESRNPGLISPGIISTGLSQLNAVFSPDGSEFYDSILIFTSNRPDSFGSGDLYISSRIKKI
jgi:hypothetical protein